MKKELNLVYRHIPSEVIEEFKRIDSNHIDIEEDRLDYFSGGPADIVLYINEHYSELLISSLLAPAAYDILKESIKLNWKKLASFYKKKDRKIEKEFNCFKIELYLD